MYYWPLKDTYLAYSTLHYLDLVWIIEVKNPENPGS